MIARPTASPAPAIPAATVENGGAATAAAVRKVPADAEAPAAETAATPEAIETPSPAVVCIPFAKAFSLFVAASGDS